MPVHILFVTYEYPPLGGGGGVFAQMLVRELRERVRMTVLTTHRPGLAVDEKQGEARIVRVPVLGRSQNAVASLPSLLSFVPSALWRGRALLGESRIDLVHTSFAVPSGPAGIALARRAGVAHVLTVHGGDLFDPSTRRSPHRTPLLRQTVRWVLRRSDRIVAPSNDTIRRVLDFDAGLQPMRIPLAVDLPAPAESQRPSDRSEGRIVLISVGRLLARKGLEDLVDAIGDLRDLPLRLILVGEGPLREAIERRVAAAGLTDRVRFAGRVGENEKWDLLRTADIYVSTTQHEAFGMVFLEALGAGLPVVAYDRGGHADFLTPNCSRLVARGDRRSFAGAIRELAEDAAERRRLGTAGRTVALEHSPGRMAESYLALYARYTASAQAT